MAEKITYETPELLTMKSPVGVVAGASGCQDGTSEHVDYTCDTNPAD